MAGIKNIISLADITVDMFTKRSTTTIILKNMRGIGGTGIISPGDTTEIDIFTKRFTTIIMENMRGIGGTGIISPGDTTEIDIFTKRFTIMTMIIKSIAAARIEEMTGRQWSLSSF
jgi:hypothetical protein